MLKGHVKQSKSQINEVRKLYKIDFIVLEKSSKPFKSN